MPKFQSVLVKEEKDLGGGRIQPGVVAFVPLNDAAKAMKISEKAIELGVYKPKAGETPTEMREKMEKKLRAKSGQ